MADARAKAVLSRLADLYGRTNYGIDLVSNLREPLARGDTVEIPDISSFTVIADGTTSTAAAAVTTNVISLSANLHPWINVELPAVASMQLLDGAWASQVAEQGLVQLKNSMDQAFLRTYLANSLCWTTGTAATYHDNVAGDALTGADILNCKAALLANDGVSEGNLIMIVSPYGEASIMNISAFIPNYQAAEQGNLGIPRLGYVYGVPVYSTNSIQRSNAVATTAVSVTSNVATATVASGHGIVAGQVISTTGLTTNVTNATVTSTTSTTIVYPCTTGDGAFGDGVGTITANSSDNLMLDKSQIFVAQQKMPSVRVVPHDDTTGDALQISAIWGRIGRTGRCRVLHSPAANA